MKKEKDKKSLSVFKRVRTERGTGVQFLHNPHGLKPLLMGTAGHCLGIMPARERGSRKSRKV